MVEQSFCAYQYCSEKKLPHKHESKTAQIVEHAAGHCDRGTHLEAEGYKLYAALEKINAIRNSIVGSQSINWSAHIYPLVAALNEAGFTGQDYADAHKDFGSMLSIIERTGRMGLCSQTHHEHLATDARRLLEGKS